MADVNQTICVDHWRLDDTYGGVYPKGARDKDVYFSPADPAIPDIKPNHRYLFKKSFARYPWQFWMEVIAYRVGQVMGVEVPPAYVGLHHLGEGGPVEYGALIEWFYGAGDVYIDGGRFMTTVIEDFDVSRGTQHNLKTIIEDIPRDLLDLLTKVADFLGESFLTQMGHGVDALAKKNAQIPAFDDLQQFLILYWANVLNFDTVIGNTDRHQDNWGWIISLGTPKTKEAVLNIPVECKPSPAFDNGTALSHEILEPNFIRFEDERYLFNYLTKPTRAKHHMKWSLEDPEPLNFYEFMRRYIHEYPFVRDEILKRLDFSRADLEERLNALPAMVDDPTCRLTERRLEFIIQMMMRRRELLLKAINA